MNSGNVSKTFQYSSHGNGNNPIRLAHEQQHHVFVSSFCLIRLTSSINHDDCSHFLFDVIASFNPFRTHCYLAACLCAADGANGAIAGRHGRTRAVSGADLCLVPFSVPIYVL
jgi:hypothetical protein